METFKYLATKLLNLTEDEVQSKYFDEDKLKDTAPDELLTAIGAKLTAAKQAETEAFDKGFKKAEAKYKTEAEKTISTVLGVEINEGDDLTEVVSKWHAENKKTKTTFTDDDVKKHPLYRELEKNRIPKDEYEKVTSEFEQYKAQSARREVLGQVKPKVWSVVIGMNPKLPSDPNVAETYRNAFLSAFDEYDYQIENDDILILKDGKRVEDNFGNPLKFQDFVKSNASKYFEFNKQAPTGGAGNGGQQGSGAVVAGMPKSWAEFNATCSTLTGKELVDYHAAAYKHLNDLGIKPE